MALQLWRRELHRHQDMSSTRHVFFLNNYHRKNCRLAEQKTCLSLPLSRDHEAPILLQALFASCLSKSPNLHHQTPIMLVPITCSPRKAESWHIMSFLSPVPIHFIRVQALPSLTIVSCPTRRTHFPLTDRAPSRCDLWNISACATYVVVPSCQWVITSGEPVAYFSAQNWGPMFHAL